jgi:CDGSH-type Zn-finger protein
VTDPVLGPQKQEAPIVTAKIVEQEHVRRLVLDEVFKHELGCRCAMCESLRTRFPIADASHADRFEEQGGTHQTFPFDATNLTSLQSIARSLSIVAVAVERTSVALESARDVLRGRDSEGKEVRGPIRAIADFLLRGQPQAAPPQTQRTPAQQQLPTQQPANAPPAQASPYAQTKRVATDQEMARFNGALKVRFDPKRWPGDSHKGRTMLQCDPNFLDIYADQIEYFAGKAKESVAAGSADENAKRDAQWGELNAAQYRRLAIDMRAGKVQQAAPPAPAYSGGGDDYG